MTCSLLLWIIAVESTVLLIGVGYIVWNLWKSAVDGEYTH